jgi:hypothetical protein
MVLNMTRITIPMTVLERERLRSAATQQMRDPRDHARYLLRQALGLDNKQPMQVSEQTHNRAEVHQDIDSAAVA